MTTHGLKTWPEYFEAVWDGRKTAELRLDDRPYEVSHALVLREYIPEARRYTGRAVHATITHIVRGGPWLMPGYVMLSLGEVRRVAE